MGCVRYEWKKFISFRFFWMLCIIVFTFNIWNLSEKVKGSWLPSNAVKELYRDLKQQPAENQGSWLQELKGSKSMRYTGNPYAEEALYDKVLKEFIQIGQYESYLEDIKKKSASMSSAIFSNETSFAYRNAKKTPAAFEKLHGLKLPADISDGVILATHAEFTDLCMVLLLMTMVYFLVVYEKKNHLYRLLKSTFRGRRYVILSKLLTGIGITCILVLFLYGGNYLFAIYKYGFGFLGRPIQSVTAMYESPYMLSVGDYLIYYLFLKMFVCCTIALMMIWMAQKMSSPAGIFLGIGSAAIAEYLLYVLLPSVSYLDILKYINFAEYLKVYPLLLNYHNLDVFAYPVNAMKLFVIVLPVCFLLFFAINIRKFSHCDKVRARRMKKWKRNNSPAFMTDWLFLHELFKNLLSNRTLWLCIGVMYGAVLVGNGMTSYKNPEEEYYQMYVTKQQGSLTEEKLRYFSEEKKKYEEIMALTPEKSGFSEEVILQKKNNIQYPYAGFMRAYSQVEYVMSSNVMIGANQLELVYETGYERLFGSTFARNRLIASVLCVLVAVYSASAVLGMEYDLKVMNLLRSTKRGRMQLLTAKIGAAFGITLVMASLIRLPSILKIVRVYPLDNWGADIRSLMFAGQSVLNCTIWEYVFLLVFFRILALFVIVLVMVGVSALCRDTILTSILGIVVFAGPLILEWSGLYKMHFWSMNALLDAHQLLQSQWSVIILEVLIFLIDIPAASCYILYEIYDRRK